MGLEFVNLPMMKKSLEVRLSGISKNFEFHRLSGLRVQGDLPQEGKSIWA
jgi:hypothetical protein